MDSLSLIDPRPWKIKNSRHSFSTLPAEVLTEILKHVHWHDLLMVRQVCKQLNDISRTRAVWTSQYQSYLAEKEFRLAAEEPIDMYSSAELESWVLQRRSADKEWEITNPVRERSIFLDYKTYTLTMVPGGRWLLAALSDSSVLCYDLEDPDMRSTVLTPPRDDPNGKLIYDVTVDIDQSNATLSFCMVHFPSDFIIQPVTGSLDLMIWRVNLRGHGSSAHLEANFLHSFPATELFTTILAVSLSGDLLARLVYTSQFRSYIEVFDWRASTALVHRRTVIFPKRTERPYSVVVLPGRQLAFVSIRNVTVYDIDIMVDDRPIAPTIPQSPSEVRWTLFDHDGDFVFQHHQSSLDIKAVTLVLTSDHRMIYHLTIPHNLNSTPHLVHHGKSTQEHYFYTVGREKAFGEKDNSILVKVGMALSILSSTYLERGHWTYCYQDEELRFYSGYL
ncbi:hypothetical protein H2248_000064 [Termitomyces sp. 'cryptogamus']|nr:hypothetical protein H2248_000064 [Termitomyces sp. 'cryptogamus']